MEYLMHHQHEAIMYLRKNIFKLNERPVQCFFKACSAEINQPQKYFNFLNTYCDADHARNISYRLSVTSPYHLFNVTIIYWYSKTKSETTRSSSNLDKREMYTGVVALIVSGVVSLVLPLGYMFTVLIFVMMYSETTVSYLNYPLSLTLTKYLHLT